VFGYFGWVYTKIRTADHLVLIALEVSDRLNSVERYLAKNELKRKIEKGDFDSALVLHDLLAVSFPGQSDPNAAAVELADELLAGSIDVNTRGLMGLTALHMSIIANDVCAVEYLLSRGANKSLTIQVGDDPTDKLDALGYVHFVDQLLPGKDRTEIANLLRDDT
tara:strand:+ start:748 stop:1242 length:495 start_codon:yes stop_codon:yes gene_type:complete